MLSYPLVFGLAAILGMILPALLGVGATWLGNKINNSSLTGAQSEQNAYNAQEAEKQRAWSAEQNQVAMQYNSAEAEKARQFTKQQDDTLYQRRVADMQAAGVNPALAIGGVSSALGSSASGSISAPSGAAASGSNPSFPQSMSDIMQGALLSKNLGLMDSQIQMNDAKTMRDLAEAGLLGEQRIGQNLANSWFEPMKEAELNNLLEDLKTKPVQRALSAQHIKESEASEAFTIVQTAIGKADAATRDQLNRATIRVTLSQAGLNSALASESKKRLGLIDAEINELYQRAIMESLQGGKYSAEELESMERAGLIRKQSEAQGMENEAKRYTVDHKKLNYWLDVAGKSASVVGQTIGGVAVGAGLKTLKGVKSAKNGLSSYNPSATSSFSLNYSGN